MILKLVMYLAQTYQTIVSSKNLTRSSEWAVKYTPGKPCGLLPSMVTNLNSVILSSCRYPGHDFDRCDRVGIYYSDDSTHALRSEKSDPKMIFSGISFFCINIIMYTG